MKHSARTWASQTASRSGHLPILSGLIPVGAACVSSAVEEPPQEASGEPSQHEGVPGGGPSSVQSPPTAQQKWYGRGMVLRLVWVQRRRGLVLGGCEFSAPVWWVALCLLNYSSVQSPPTIIRKERRIELQWTMEYKGMGSYFFSEIGYLLLRYTCFVHYLVCIGICSCEFDELLVFQAYLLLTKETER